MFAGSTEVLWVEVVVVPANVEVLAEASPAQEAAGTAEVVAVGIGEAAGTDQAAVADRAGTAVGIPPGSSGRQ